MKTQEEHSCKHIQCGYWAVVCLFQGWAWPGFPLCLMDVSLFAEIPKVMNSLCTIGIGNLDSKTSICHFRHKRHSL